MKNINKQWQTSEEYHVIREFSKLLIKAGEEIEMPDIEITEMLNQKQDMNVIIKHAWLARNKQ